MVEDQFDGSQFFCELLIDLETGYNSPQEVFRITEPMSDNIGELSHEIPVVDW